MTTQNNHLNSSSAVDRPQVIWRESLSADGYDELIAFHIKGNLPTRPQTTSMPMYCVQFMVKGTLTCLINHVRYEVQAPSGFLIFSDQSIEPVEASGDCEFYGVAVTLKMGENIAFMLPQMQLAMLYIHPHWNIFEPIMQTLVQYMNLLRQVLFEHSNTDVVIHLVRSLFYYTALNFKENFLSQSGFSRQEEIVGRFLALVESECSKEHKNDWYAEQLCLSPKYLANVVRQVLDKSVTACVEDALLRKSKSMLKASNMTMQEIAFKLGFKNQSHFGVFFKRLTGQTPTAYKSEAEAF